MLKELDVDKLRKCPYFLYLVEENGDILTSCTKMDAPCQFYNCEFKKRLGENG